ncbi:Leucine-rich repeat typical subtype [Arabidopsis thaliana x Arabidopsis arenosa]|uniref:Leucine-rich repeat typical subtype n=1 Tax=Arabidopsis thaliana x Arabidopsis arenosa TaxID=1240361 RepID=A0A8T2FYH2_9BRAS|nr:Leucine-rich repeat typical subtype [Arabidopsis thaliana x Arabidopsis arenosa]
MILSLILGANNLVGEIPFSLGNISHLTDIALCENDLAGEIPSSFENLSHLTYLDLSQNNLVGEIPSFFGSFNQLYSLAVENNEFSGNFPLILLNLSDLSLSRNQFTGKLPPNMSSLSDLVLFYADANAFTRTIPSYLLNIPSLSCFDLSDNQLNGNLEFGNISSSLSDLLLGNNNFRGSIHKSISKLVNLYTLDLSHFNTQGSVNFSIFSDLKLLVDLRLSHLNTTTTVDFNTFLSSFKSLATLDLSGNHVSVTNKSSVSNPPLLSRFNLSGWGVTEFPEFLRTQQTTEILDISNNKINGQVPCWLWTLPNLDYVNLSNNTFTGFQRLMVPSSWQPSMNYFSGANNNFTGNIPAFICALRSLAMLDLSDNKFNGSIPRCMGNFSSTLQALHLRKNHFSGGFPENISESLKSLDVGHNHLVGKLPRSLVRISSLEVLNVESNKINDTFPFWLSSLQELQVLVLRSNAFHGPMQQTRFSKLRIIDVSHNHFNGTLPSDFFVNWTTMVLLGENEDHSNGEYMGTSYYSDSIVVMNKVLEMEMVRDIPQELGDLSYLAYMNFSHNQLVGLVPGGTQFLTQNCSSFEENAGHFGPSLEKVCDIHGKTMQESEMPGSEEDEEEVISWIAAAIGFIPGIAFGLMMGYILVWYKPEWFMNVFGKNKSRSTSSTTR